MKEHRYCAESRAACESWLRRYAQSRRVNGFAPWTIVLRSDDRVIGWGGLNIDPEAHEWGPEVSYSSPRKPNGLSHGIFECLIVEASSQAQNDLSVLADRYT